MAIRTTEVPRPDWSPALNAFSTMHEGWLVSVDVLSADLGAQADAVNLPLIGVSCGPSDGGAVAITLGRAADRVTHVIQAPQHVWIERTAAGADVALAIDSADGARTILRFRTAALPETVDGISRP